MRAFGRRFAGLFRRQQHEREMTAEFEHHLRMRSEEYARRGLSPEEARRRAVLDSGGLEAAKEAYRDRLALPLVETLFQDVRYAVRTLRQNAAFTAAAVVTLALGIGATIAMFSVAHAVLWRPLPYAAPERLVELSETNPLKRWTHAPIAPANFADWRKMNSVFSAIAGYSTRDLDLTGQGEPQRLKALVSTGNLLDVLGVRPLLGRGFREEETYEGHHRVAILSWNFWQSAFAGDPNVIGRRLALSGREFEIVGVMPREFFFGGRDRDLYAPLGVRPGIFVETRRSHWMEGIARLKDGVSLEQAQENMNAVAQRLEETYPDTNTKMGIRLQNFHASMSDAKRPALRLLLAAVGVLFLIVCSNVANLQLGRSAARNREIGIRQALGAGRGRLVRQFLTESLVLSLFGGTLGLGLAALARVVLVRLAPSSIPNFAELRMDGFVVVFGAVVTILAPMLFGLIPALSSARPEALRDRSGTLRGSRLTRNIFVACEIGFSVILVIGAGLLIRTLIELERVQLGFLADSAVSFGVRLPAVRYPKDEQVTQAMQNLERRLAAVPGVEAVGATMTLPLQGYGWTTDATPEGRGGDDYERELRVDVVTRNYFRAIGAKLVRGRFFDDHDDRKSTSVTVVNEALERAYFRGQSAIGKRLRFGRPTDKVPWNTIIGVVADIKQDKVSDRVLPQAFAVHTQKGAPALKFVVRGSAGSDALLAAARREVKAMDPSLVISDSVTLRQLTRESVGDQRFRTWLLAGFAGIALFLAALGVYGVLAYSVTRRSREIGVRMALGASAPRVLALVVGEGLRPVLIGLGGGLAAALFLGGLLRSLLFGVVPLDVLTYGATVAVVTAVAVGACAIPAAAAVRVDPMISLREQ